MFPFWESVVAPIIRASGGRRIVEIGALRGENTVKMLEDLGPDTELHIIDPLPAFDPAELEHDHSDLPPNHPHLREGHGGGTGQAHQHAVMIDPLHPHWPRRTA